MLGLTGQPIHTGSWGLPDFGLTEAISGAFGQGRTAQGGSNLQGDQSQTTLVPAAGGNFVPLGGAGAYGVNSVNAGSKYNALGNLSNSSIQIGGGSGGGGDTQLQQLEKIKASGGLNPSQQTLYDQLTAGLNSQNSAQLASLNTQYDQNAADLNSQLPYLDQQRQSSLTDLNNQFNSAQNQVNTQKQAAQTNTDQQIQDAGSIAQSTQSQNRNVLRALGIINSSAAGDLLTKPMNEFGKIRANLQTALTQRNNELDNFLNDQIAQHQSAVNQIQNNYGNLVGKIQSDLRFNDRQRADAIQAANAALQTNLANLQQSILQYQQQVQLQKQQYASAANQYLNSYTQPTADTSQISNMALSTPGQQQTGVNIVNPQKKQSLTGL